MTDLTDQELRDAVEWGRRNEYSGDPAEANAAIVILATVDAPALTLAEELRHIAEHWEEWATATITSAIRAAADRANQTEQERDEAKKERDHFFREVENVRNWKEQLLNERDEARAELERLTAERDRLEAAQYLSDGSAWGGPVREPTAQKGAESNAETTDPADVKPGEAWRVQVGDAIGTGICDADPVGRHWAVYLDGGSQVGLYRADQITLVSRLVPAPRVITNPDELEQLRNRSMVLDGVGRVCTKNSPGLFSRSDLGLTIITTEQCFGHGPATVLWEPATP